MYKIFIIACSSALILFSDVSAQPYSKIVPGDYLANELIVLVGSLAGKKGNVRRHPPSGWGPCQKGYKKYIAASGHAAYAMTPLHPNTEVGYICGWALNRSSTKSAEATAMRACKNGLKKYKVGVRGKCQIYASK